MKLVHLPNEVLKIQVREEEVKKRIVKYSEALDMLRNELYADMSIKHVTTPTIYYDKKYHRYCLHIVINMVKHTFKVTNEVVTFIAQFLTHTQVDSIMASKL